MRTEKEMFDLIIETARKDDRIRAVYMNGSRANPNAPRDIFQDYDIVYVVTETAAFREDKSWIDRFGQRLYMQYPEAEDSPDTKEWYGWLIQFADGNRLDLHVGTVDRIKKIILKDRLCKILLDKDRILPQIPSPTDEDYWIRRPAQSEFSSSANEFWWCLNNVAKGLWRKEIPYTMDMLNLCVRPMLVRMLEWNAGVLSGFQASGGKSGKYLNRWLPADVWNRFLLTYPRGNTEDIWNAVLIMCGLFQEMAEQLSELFGFEYDGLEAENSLRYLISVQRLPETADQVIIEE